MDKLLSKLLKIIGSFAFLLVGIALIYYVYSLPCESIEQIPSILQRMICLSSNANSVIMTSIGSSCLLGGIWFFIKNVVGD